MSDLMDGDLGVRVPIGDWFTNVVDWIDNNAGVLLDAIGSVLLWSTETIQDGLNAVPVLVMVLLIAALSWWARGPRFVLFVIPALLLVRSMDLWERSMDTLALVIVAGVVAMALAVPLGVAAASSQVASSVIRPVMDFMQTMPAFVYLIPALFFFSIGIVPGVVSTIIFAMPPGVRLTELGIRQVDSEVVEAGHAFGSSPFSILTRIQIPMATPTIMAGVNQVIMLSLSMVVIAGMVGAGGLGELVYQGVTRFQLGLGFEAGLAVVIIAIVLDRLTSALSEKSPVARAQRAGSRSS